MLSTEDRNQWQDISINPDIPELIYHGHGSRQTRQYYQLSRPEIEVVQATADYHFPGHQHEGSQPTLIPLLGLQVIILVFLPFHLSVPPPPILDHLIFSVLPAHVLEVGANAWRRWCRFPLGKGHDVPRVRSGDSGPPFIGLWLFSIISLHPPLFTCVMVCVYLCIYFLDQFSYLYSSCSPISIFLHH